MELQGPRKSPNARRQASKTLFVTGLSGETTETTSKGLLEGSVQARRVTNKETASSKGLVLKTSTVSKMPKPPSRPWKMVKLKETKLLWTCPT